MWEKREMEANWKDSVRTLRRKAVVSTFFDTIKSLGKSDPLFTIEGAIKKALCSRAPRFFVTYENARRFVSLLVRGKEIPITNRNKLAMYKELYQRYMARAKEDIERSYLVLEDIIEEPAPSFYMDYETFKGIVYSTLRKR